jgi:hypothetical protein
MVNLMSSSVVDSGFESRSDKAQTIKLIFIASLLSTQH